MHEKKNENYFQLVYFIFYLLCRNYLIISFEIKENFELL